MSNEEYKAILAAHALGALDEKESREIDAALAVDESLRAEFEELRATSAALIYTSEPAEPSSGVRAQILQKIKQTPQDSRPKFTVISGGDSRMAKSTAVFGSKPTEVLPTAKRGFWSYVPGVVAAAASIAVLILTYALVNATRQNAQAQTQIAELNRKNSENEQKLNQTSGELARIRSERELLGSPTTIVASLAGTENSPQARARLVFDKQTGKAMLFVEGLPDAPQGKAYQIWWISDPTHPTPGGTFKPHDNGKGELRDQIPAQNLNAGVFAVTLEPETGSPSPTTKPYLISKT